MSKVLVSIGEKMDITHIEFHAYNPDEKNVSVEFDTDYNELNCWKFHDLCKRFAYAFGYATESIEKIFGSTNYKSFL